MILPTASQVTSLFLYGTPHPPTNFTSDSLTVVSPRPVLLIDYNEFFDVETGPGRFSVASNSEMVSTFFDAIFGFCVNQSGIVDCNAVNPV